MQARLDQKFYFPEINHELICLGKKRKQVILFISNFSKTRLHKHLAKGKYICLCGKQEYGTQKEIDNNQNCVNKLGEEGTFTHFYPCDRQAYKHCLK